MHLHKKGSENNASQRVERGHGNTDILPDGIIPRLGMALVSPMKGSQPPGPSYPTGTKAPEKRGPLARCDRVVVGQNARQIPVLFTGRKDRSRRGGGSYPWELR